MNQEDLRVRRTQNDIQLGFIKMLQHKSFSNITINDICTAGMVGRSTFYHHYPDKYALLDALVTQEAAKFDQLLATRMVGIQQDQLLINLYQGLAQDADRITTLLDVHTSSVDLNQRYLASLKDHLDHLWPQISLDVPREFILDFYAHSALMAISWALKHGHEDQIATFMNQMTKNVLNG